ncbi:MAG: nucleotidyltransferase family protein [Fusobacteriaceae bacterium]|nr:nucleotidyltransferase family protein [Fusobacteriaceae bacterium]
MEATGIIVEYNPLHKGHLFHLQKARAANQDAVLVAVMSGDFVQRGEPAIACKELRAGLAVEAGVNLVAELPPFYSTQSAEIFAFGAVGILDALGCARFVFGSETADLTLLREKARFAETEAFRTKLRNALKEGVSYPDAFAAADGGLPLLSNDILGVEYLRALERLQSPMEAAVIKREKNGCYDLNRAEKFASGFSIRAMKEKGEDPRDFLPEISHALLKRPWMNWRFLYPFLRLRILKDPDALPFIQDVEEGYGNRLYEAAWKATDYQTFFREILTKRLTIGRTQRILTHALTGLTRELTDLAREEIPYVRILAWDHIGQAYLRELKRSRPSGQSKHGQLPILFTTYRNITKKLSAKQLRLLRFSRTAEIIYKTIEETCFKEDSRWN